jgi:hypothetical protein
MNKTKLYAAAIVIMLSASASAEPPQFVSEYSSLAKKDCKITEKGVGYNWAPCPGHDGYGVAIDDDEATSFVSLKVRGKDVPLEASVLKPEAPLSFSMSHVVGEKLEWRYRVAGGKKTLVAVIYRVGDDTWAPKQSILFVTRVQGDVFCPLGVVKTNEAAQQLADGGKPCPKEIE